MRSTVLGYAWLLLLPLLVQATELRLGIRTELSHPGKGHEFHLSGPSVATTPAGEILVAWIAQQHHTNHLYLARPRTPGSPPVRVNPDGLEVESLHQSPGLAVGPAGEIYLSWSSSKTKPDGALFASDLRLSRSLDRGQSFEPPLRVNEDRAISHAFEGLAVAADGTVLLAWIDSRDGHEHAGTYLSRIIQRGTQVERTLRLDRETCVCCRVHLQAGLQDTVAALWRKVFPGHVRDMVISVSHDRGQAFPPAMLVHADGWRLNACPHRGGAVGMDGTGRVYVSWYTEGGQETPRLLLTTSPDGQHFAPPQRVDLSTASIPDHPRLAVHRTGAAVVVWEDATAVRRRVLVRYTTDGGVTWSSIHTLSHAIKAYAPDIAVMPTGEFVVVWHEEQFPTIKTVVQSVHLEGER